MGLADIKPAVIHIKLTRRTDNRLRLTFYEGSVVADLSGDTVQFLAKDAPGGNVKVDVAATVLDQTGELKGCADIVLPRAALVDAGAPNDAPTSDLKWTYQIIRTHAGLISAPMSGDLILTGTI